MKRIQLVLTVVLALGMLVTSPGAAGGVDGKDRPCPTATPAERAAARLAIEHLPLLFVENRGQTDPRVAWSLEGRGLTAYFGTDGITWAIVRDGQRWAVKLDFVGANPDVMPEGSDPAATVFSYFKGPCEEWRTRVPSCTTLTYRELWPGIDLTYTAGQDRLKYAFTVKPGADPSQIRIACRGAQLRVDASGELEIWTPIGEIRDAPPSSWQEIDGRSVDVPTAFRIAPAGGVAGYGFDVGAFDASRPLVIDPAVVVFAGYIGGSVADYGAGIAVDQDGLAYVTGHTAGGTFPADPGLDETYNDGSADAFVAKVAADGSGLLYAGYIGGNAGDFGHGIAVSVNGFAYVTGVTHSYHFTFPVTIGPDLTADSPPSNFVAKVDPTASDLNYCGFIDGTNGFPAIAIDDEGGAYLTGAVNSPELFPADGLLDQIYNGGTDAFIAKVSAGGTGLDFAGYLGGSSGDTGVSIAVDADHFVYVTGHTSSSQKTFPVKKGPDLTYGGNGDVWVAKLHAIEGIQYCGYVGGSGVESGGGIAIDSAGAAYVTGTTFEPTDGWPATVGPDLTYNGGGSDAFIAKVAADGGGFAYAGFIGGAGIDYGSAIAVDDDRNAHVAGNTSSDETTFPVLSGPDLTYGGALDVFVAKVKANGLGLLYCGYLGGDQEEFPLFVPGGIALDSDGHAYVSGGSSSTQASFAVLGGPDTTHNGLYDAFVAKLDASSDVPPPPPPVTLDVTLLKGALADSPKTAKDKVKVRGLLAFTGDSPDGILDPATDSVSVSIGSAESMVEFEIPAADAGWTSKNGKHRWKSAKGALPKLVVVLDTAKQKFSVSVSKGVFSSPPDPLIHVSLVAGNDAGGVESTWIVKKPGVLKFVP